MSSRSRGYQYLSTSRNFQEYMISYDKEFAVSPMKQLRILDHPAALIYTRADCRKMLCGEKIFVLSNQDNSYSVRLRGVKGMPKPETQLSIDFSSLLGPLFFMWLLQLLLPVSYYILTIVIKKEANILCCTKCSSIFSLVFFKWNILTTYNCFITSYEP